MSFRFIRFSTAFVISALFSSTAILSNASANEYFWTDFNCALNVTQASILAPRPVDLNGPNYYNFTFATVSTDPTYKGKPIRAVYSDDLSPKLVLNDSGQIESKALSQTTLGEILKKFGVAPHITGKSDLLQSDYMYTKLNLGTSDGSPLASGPGGYSSGTITRQYHFPTDIEDGLSFHLTLVCAKSYLGQNLPAWVNSQSQKY